MGNSPETMKTPKSSVLYLHIFCHSFHTPLTVGLELKKIGPPLLSTCQMPRKVQGKNNLPANSSPRCDSQKLGVHLISLLGSDGCQRGMEQLTKDADSISDNHNIKSPWARLSPLGSVLIVPDTGRQSSWR